MTQPGRRYWSWVYGLAQGILKDHVPSKSKRRNCQAMSGFPRRERPDTQILYQLEGQSVAGRTCVRCQVENLHRLARQFFALPGAAKAAENC